MPPSIEARAETIRRKRAEADALTTEADAALARLMPAAQAAGMTVAELAERCGFRTRKAVYDAVKRRNGA